MAYSAGPDQVGIAKSVPFERTLVPGKNIGKYVFIVNCLGLNKDELFAGLKTAWIGIGEIVGGEIGKVCVCWRFRGFLVFIEPVIAVIKSFELIISNNIWRQL